MITHLSHLGARVTHHSDVIMSPMASLIAGASIIYSSVCWGADQRKHQRSVSLAFVTEISPVTGEFPAQRASNAENVSEWWCHHAQVPLVTSKLTWWRLSVFFVLPSIWHLGYTSIVHDEKINAGRHWGIIHAIHSHDDVIKWINFPRYWPFVRGIHRSPVNSPKKVSDAELWRFLRSVPE